MPLRAASISVRPQPQGLSDPTDSTRPMPRQCGQTGVPCIKLVRSRRDSSTRLNDETPSDAGAVVLQAVLRFFDEPVVLGLSMPMKSMTTAWPDRAGAAARGLLGGLEIGFRAVDRLFRRVTAELTSMATRASVWLITR